MLRHVVALRQNYWFWPSVMTGIAFLLGFLLPYLDARLGADWTQSVPFLRTTDVDGARAILTTLAGATLGVAGVAFSITIVAVSFASSNYGPRLIGNFMADRTNQIVLGVFVATFVYCITVLVTVHAGIETEDRDLAAFVPQISVLCAVALTLASVGALIGYIHHIPESINIMNLVASIGHQLRNKIVHGEDDGEVSDFVAWSEGAERAFGDVRLRAETAGYLQVLDMTTLRDLAGKHDFRIRIDQAAGDFIVVGEVVLTLLDTDAPAEKVMADLRRSVTIGSNRTIEQDLLFLSDQLVEVAVRALSPGINDPQTGVLCLDWLRAALDSFARREPPLGPPAHSGVLYSRVTFEKMLDRSFDRLRQNACGDRTVAIHAINLLGEVGAAACRPAMAEACAGQIERYGRSAAEQLVEADARAEVADAVEGALDRLPAPYQAYTRQNLAADGG
jgi:uncharacterized membrane protein